MKTAEWFAVLSLPGKQILIPQECVADFSFMQHTDRMEKIRSYSIDGYFPKISLAPAFNFTSDVNTSEPSQDGISFGKKNTLIIKDSNPFFIYTDAQPEILSVNLKEFYFPGKLFKNHFISSGIIAFSFTDNMIRIILDPVVFARKIDSEGGKVD